MFPVQWRGLRLVVVSVSDRLLESLARALDVVFKRLEERTMDKNDEIISDQDQDPHEWDIMYCVECRWPIAPEGVAFVDDSYAPLPGARRERCRDTACVGGA